MGRAPNPTPEQKRARDQLADARRAELERKRRTRRLIQLGGVLAAHDFGSPEQVDELMAALSQSDGWAEWLHGRGVAFERTEG